MESGVRKLLPRVQPSESQRRDSDLAGEPLRNGNGIVDAARPERSQQWSQPVEEEPGPKRKRQHVEDQSPRGSQQLPSLRQLLPTPAHTLTMEHERAGPVRLIRVDQNTYAQQGAFKFLAPRPAREFPDSISKDRRPLSFAQVDPELMEVFKHAWYLRHYVRERRLQGEPWNDHIFYNDVYGINNILYTWICQYEPGHLQYPASILYKQCLWVFFQRSIQVSQSTSAFRHMVDDGLHFLRTFENELGPNGDKTILLVPIFLLGSTSFYAGQRAEIWTSLERLDPTYSIDAVVHAAKSLERIWEMMDDPRSVGVTWDWEQIQAHRYANVVTDRSLIDLLWDPHPPPQQQPPPQPPPRVRSPETYENFDSSRFRPAPGPIPPQPQQTPPEMHHTQREEPRDYSPSQQRSPPRNHSSASQEAESMRMDGTQDGAAGHAEIAAAPRPFLAPPHPGANMQSNDIIHVLQRKATKSSKSSVPPCPTCGKELKNPSDAQKHHLQHSKPFRCRENGCTRTQGFATENDLQRHRKSVHGASPRIGNKIGYICSACPDPSDGTTRKWWPRLDNFKAHIRRKHQDADEESLIQSSASARRPEDAYSDSSYSHFRTPQHSQDPYGTRTNTLSTDQGTPQSQSISPIKGHGNSESQYGQYAQFQYHDSNQTQGDGEGSEEQDGTPKTENESDLSDAGEGEEDPMDVEGDGEADGEGEGEGEGDD